MIVDGKEVISPEKNRGMVLLEARLFPWLSVIKNIEYALNEGSKEEKLFRQRLLKTPSVVNTATGKKASEFVTPSVIRDIHKLLRNCFHQAV